MKEVEMVVQDRERNDRESLRQRIVPETGDVERSGDVERKTFWRVALVHDQSDGREAYATLVLSEEQARRFAPGSRWKLVPAEPEAPARQYYYGGSLEKAAREGSAFEASDVLPSFGRSGEA